MWSRVSVWLVVALAAGGCGGARTTGPAQAGSGVCGDDMTMVSPPGVCMDRYEASRGNGDKAASVEGAMPWVNLSQKDAQAACEEAGKRLCTKEEWTAACTGPPPGRTYPFGDNYAPKTCNAVDNGAGAAVPSGSLKGCTGAFPQLYDLVGNVWEWTASCGLGKCRVRGGSFKSNGKSVKCVAGADFGTGDSDETIGFRCCRNP
ncbi:MAG: SUMF1/EgtB/PvdO family nonheme iron enzyme [Deltaproteobacteria bacterium]|nr:SUMF1/EgtB/PvdO family nonheme iron enzyme [Deltaproteobacteria bacterium]